MAMAMGFMRGALFVAMTMTTIVTRGLAWMPAHATFYGDITGLQGMGGACGYGDLMASGYGLYTAALSTVLYENGVSCGSCYEIMCDDKQVPQWCLKGNRVMVTATNLCPPNPSLPNDNQGWCNVPRKHFDLSMPAFLRIAKYKAGIVPIVYRRVPCKKPGGIKFQIKGVPYFELVLITNVGGRGDLTQAWIKGTNTDWIKMSRNWGSNFHVMKDLRGQALSFRLTSSSGKTLTIPDVAPANWQFGQSYNSYKQFRK